MKSLRIINREQGSVLVIELILLAGVIAVAAFAFYNYQQNKKTTNVAQLSLPHSQHKITSSPTSTPRNTSTPLATSTLTDQQAIATTVKENLQQGGNTPVKNTQIVLKGLEGNYAIVEVVSGGGGGGTDLLQKASGTWSVKWEGQDGLSDEISSLGFPQDFNTADGTTILFTY